MIFESKNDNIERVKCTIYQNIENITPSSVVNGLDKKTSVKENIVSQIKLDIPTYTKDNLPKNLSLIEAVKPGSRNL